MIIFIRSAPVFNCHLRLKVESGDDAELFDRTTAGGRSSFVDPRSNPGTKGKRVRERERESQKESKKKFPPFPPRRRGRFPRVTYHGASPPLWYFFCRLTVPLSLPLFPLALRWQRPHTRAQNDVLHARSRLTRAHRMCARTRMTSDRILCHV